jgi:hypothetical protein
MGRNLQDLAEILAPEMPDYDEFQEWLEESRGPPDF